MLSDGTVLDVGAVTDGEFLKRSGTSITSGAPSASIAPLVVEDANTIAQRNSTTSQRTNIYKTYTNASNYERLGVSVQSGNFVVATEKAGSGGDNILVVQAGSHLYLQSANGTHGWHIRSDTGLFEANGSQGIGAGGRISGLELLASGTKSSMPTSTDTAFIGWSSGPLMYNVNGFVSLPNVALPDWPTATSVGAPSHNLDNGTGRYMQALISSGAGSMTGMSTGAGTSGVSYLFVNENASDTITIKHEDSGSTAANRFHCSTGADIVLSAGQAADVTYVTRISRWRVFKRN